MTKTQTRSAATGRERLRLFLSYSRRDTDFAVALRDRLIAAAFDAYIDVEDIAKGEPWRERLGRLIAEADAVLFLISPSSVASDVCSWEINEAERLGKRILPIVAKPTPQEDVPGRLARLNFTFLETPAQEAAEFPKLLAALRDDADWVREHTRLGEIAGRWDAAGRPTRLLLRGEDIVAAETWRDNRPLDAPELTPAHRALLAASRRGAARRRTGWIIGAGAVAVGATLLAIVALAQREEAQRQRAEAEIQRAAAQTNEARAREERDAALLTQSRFLADLARQACAADDAGTCLALALEALPSPGAEDPRPYAPAAEAALVEALNGLREQRVVAAAPAPIRALAVGPDARWVAVLARTDHQTARPAVLEDGEIAGVASVRDLGAGAVIATLAAGAPDPDAISLDVDPTTGLVAVGDRDAHIRLYEADTGALRASVDTGSDRPVLVTRISPDGARLLASSTVRAQVFDLPALLRGETRVTAVLDHRVAGITGAAFSPGADEVAITSSDGYLTRWRLAPGAAEQDPQSPAEGTGARIVDRRQGEEGWALAAAFVGPRADGAPRGGLFFANGDGALTAVDPAFRVDRHDGAVRALAPSPDGALLASASDDGAARLWTLDRAAAEAGPDYFAETSAAVAGHRGAVTAAAWTGAATFLTGGEDGTVRLWAAAAPAAPRRLGDYAMFCVNGGVFALDGAVMVTGCGDGRVRLWDGKTGAPLWRSAPLPGVQPRIAVSGDGRRAAALGADGDVVVVFDLSARREIARIPLERGERIALDHAGARLAAATRDGVASLYPIGADGAGAAQTLPPHAAEPLAMAFAPGDARLAISANDGVSRLYDPDTGALVAELGGHSAVVWDTIFTPDGAAAVTISGAGEARLWATADGALLRDFVGHRASIWRAALSPDGALLATAGFDDLKIWRVADGTLIQTIDAPARSAVAFRPDGARLAIGRGARVDILRVDGWETVAGLATPAAVGDIAFAPDGRAALILAPTARFWRLPLDAADAIARGRSAVPRCLTADQRAAAYLPPEPPRFCAEQDRWPVARAAE